MLDGINSGLQRCGTLAEPYALINLTQAIANEVILEMAACRCRRVYTGTSPFVQVAIGRCKAYFPSEEERRGFLDKVAICTNGDFPGLASAEGLSVTGAGQKFQYVDQDAPKPDGPAGREEPGMTSDGTDKKGRRGWDALYLILPMAYMLSLVHL
jgi:hypothetical protein